MLDLSTFSRFYEFKWFDGESVWLKKPSEAMLRKVAALEDRSDFEALEELRKIVIDLIKDNEEGRKFTKADFDNFDAVLASMVLKDYMEEVGRRLGE